MVNACIIKIYEDSAEFFFFFPDINIVIISLATERSSTWRGGGNTKYYYSHTKIWSHAYLIEVQRSNMALNGAAAAMPRPGAKKHVSGKCA